jgi:hypothetical protein
VSVQWIAFTLASLAALIASLAPATGLAAWETGFVLRDDNSAGVLRSWDQSVGVFLGLTRPLASKIELAPRLTTRIGWFDRYDGRCPPCAGLGCRCRFEGKGLRTLEGTLSLRATVGSTVRRFFGFSAGMLAADVGQITRETWPLNRPDLRSLERVQGTGKTVTKVLLGLDAGVIFRRARGGFGIGFEGSMRKATDASTEWFQLACLIQLR